MRAAGLTAADAVHHGALFDEALATAFLQSTSFIAAQSEGAPLVFTGLFDPYRSPCANQFARPSEPETVAALDDVDRTGLRGVTRQH